MMQLVGSSNVHFAVARISGEADRRCVVNTSASFGQVARRAAIRSWKPIASAVTEVRGVNGADQLPVAHLGVKAIVAKPLFVLLHELFAVHGGLFRLKFGPKSFVIVSDPQVTKHVLKDNAKSYSKGMLAEILKFVMGNGILPADGELWRARRRAIVPALHKQYVEGMIHLFARASTRLCNKLDVAAETGQVVEAESLFSRFALDIIGKAMFNYEFDSLSQDTGVVKAVYIILQEAAERVTAVIPYWKIPFANILFPSQRRVGTALKLINETLDTLIVNCRKLVEEEETSHVDKDASILRFLLSTGEEVTSTQLRDDLMTMLIAGHETSGAVLTWAFYLLTQNPAALAKLQEEVDMVLGDRRPTLEDFKQLKYTRRVINETLRMYPAPPILLRRSTEEDMLGRYPIKRGEDVLISSWNLHRSPALWENPEDFCPERWPLDGPDPNESSENFRYIPFGGGPRKCVGDVFATHETVMAVAMLVRRFDFQTAPDFPPVVVVTGATIRTASGFHMRVKRRNHVLSLDQPISCDCPAASP